jgi:hypothetical protein
LLYRFGGDIITVLVGPKAATATRFFVQADLVSQHSNSFQACLKKGWKEAEERIVRLPDLPSRSGDAFEDFHSFLYTGKVYTAMEGEENLPGADWEWTRIENAWILGEVLLSVSFKDVVLDAVLHKMSSSNKTPTAMFFRAYKYSPKGSPIRRLMVDSAVYTWSEDTLSKPQDEVWKSDPATVVPFYQSVAVGLLKWKLQPEMAKKVGNPTKHEGTCFYHEHGDKPCYKTMFQGFAC